MPLHFAFNLGFPHSWVLRLQGSSFGASWRFLEPRASANNAQFYVFLRRRWMKKTYLYEFLHQTRQNASRFTSFCILGVWKIRIFTCDFTSGSAEATCFHVFFLENRADHRRKIVAHTGGSRAWRTKSRFFGVSFGFSFG